MKTNQNTNDNRHHERSQLLARDIFSKPGKGNMSQRNSPGKHVQNLVVVHEILEEQLEFSRVIIESLNKSASDTKQLQSAMDQVFSEIDKSHKSITNYERQKARSHMRFLLNFALFIVVCCFVLYQRLPVKQIVIFLNKFFYMLKMKFYNK